MDASPLPPLSGLGARFGLCLCPLRGLWEQKPGCGRGRAQAPRRACRRGAGWKRCGEGVRSPERCGTQGTGNKGQGRRHLPGLSRSGGFGAGAESPAGGAQLLPPHPPAPPRRGPALTPERAASASLHLPGLPSSKADPGSWELWSPARRPRRAGGRRAGGATSGD